MSSDYQFNINGMSSSPEADLWFDEMFAKRKLTSDYDEEEVVLDDDVDLVDFDTYDNKDED
jgi:hypothetical protein